MLLRLETSVHLILVVVMVVLRMKMRASCEDAKIFSEFISFTLHIGIDNGSSNFVLFLHIKVSKTDNFCSFNLL